MVQLAATNNRAYAKRICECSDEYRGCRKTCAGCPGSHERGIDSHQCRWHDCTLPAILSISAGIVRSRTHGHVGCDGCLRHFSASTRCQSTERHLDGSGRSDLARVSTSHRLSVLGEELANDVIVALVGLMAARPRPISVPVPIETGRVQVAADFYRSRPSARAPEAAGMQCDQRPCPVFALCSWPRLRFFFYGEFCGQSVHPCQNRRPVPPTPRASKAVQDRHAA